MRKVLSVMTAGILAAGLWGCSQPQDDNQVVVYTSRHDHLIKPAFDAFTQATGIKVNYITDNAGALITRLEAEGERSPADLLITVDAGNLWNSAEKGLLSPVQSELLERNVPEYLQDPDNLWFGLTTRARTLVYSTDRVDPAELSSYEALAEPQWQGRLCLRTSKSVYNQSLVATMIERLGEDAAEQVVSGWVSNQASDPFPNDTAVMEAILAGQCDVGIVNTYYYGRLQQSDPELPLALHFANQDSSGTHVNISGAGVTQSAKNRENAIALLEWMSEPQAQRLLADENREYPANREVPAAEQVRNWGEFKADSLNVSIAGARQIDAVKLMDRAGYR